MYDDGEKNINIWCILQRSKAVLSVTNTYVIEMAQRSNSDLKIMMPA